MKKILLLNGPPRCGKDTLAKLLVENHGFAHFKITQRWKERVHGLYGVNVPHDYFEDVKDQPNAVFQGLSPRQAYIKVWEEYFMVAHGENVLLDWLITDIDNCEQENIVISDLGFNREAHYLFSYFGSAALIVKMYRAGFDFTNDTRKYVERSSTVVKTKRGKEYRYALLHNDAEPEDLIDNLKFIWLTAYNAEL